MSNLVRKPEDWFSRVVAQMSYALCFRCLQSVIEGCGHEFNDYVDQDLLDLIFRALTHTNRFVRETGYYVCSSLVSCGLVRDGKSLRNQNMPM